jgi:hypothetical protein
MLNPLILTMRAFLDPFGGLVLGSVGPEVVVGK